MTNHIADEFESLEWHDAVLLEVSMDRRSPGKHDTVVLTIEWTDGRQQVMRFTDCYELDARMNFGIVAQESILSARCVPESGKLAELVAAWSRIGADLRDVQCFEITMNSTASVISIFAKHFEMSD